MATTMTPSLTPSSPEVDLAARGGWRRAKNGIMTALMFASFVAVTIPLVAILWHLVSKGLGVVLEDFPEWFTAEVPISQRRPGPGMGPAIVGTLMMTVLATFLAVPLGILGAVYLHEYGGPGLWSRTIRFMATVMTGVPSIVMGLFIYIVYTLTFGLSAFGGALGLACLMLPVVIRGTEEMLRLVPDHLREASYALGTRKSRTILTIVLPAAMPGIVSTCLLAVARAAGETAPLLFTIGASTAYNWNPFQGANNALSTQIFANATSPFDAAQQRAWGAALTLVGITFVLTIAARTITARLAKKR